MAEQPTQTAKILFRLIERKYGSDAAFERELGLPAKTVSNWRRGLSSSYMKILPDLARIFSIRVEDLLMDPASEKPVDAAELYALLQEAEGLPKERRERLYRLIRDMLSLYLAHE